MANIIISKFTDEEYEKAERALSLRMASKGTSFEKLLLDSLFIQVNNPDLQLNEKQMLEIYELVTSIKNKSPGGVAAVRELRERYILDFIAEQQRYESENN